MNLASRIVAGLTGRRTTTLSAPDEWLKTTLTGGTAYSGKSVTAESSAKIVPVYSAVSLVAGAIGSLPLIIYKRTRDGRERATTHRTWPLLHDQPNPEMAADELWELLAGHLLLWGNAFVWKERNTHEQVYELWPIKPDRVRVGRDSRGKFFAVDNDNSKRYDESEILHIRGLGNDGLVGLSPVQEARQMLGNVLAAEEFQGRFYAEGAHLGGVLQHPNKLSQEAADRLKASWTAKHAGLTKVGKTAILEEGMTWQQTGIPLKDAQFIETEQFNDLRIAQLFRIPPSMLGAKTGDSLTYATSEGQALDFVRWTLRRWLVRIERSLLRDPDLYKQGTRIYPEFLVDALLRASTKERYEAYDIALTSEFMTVDEVRQRENLPPLTQQESDRDEDDDES